MAAPHSRHHRDLPPSVCEACGATFVPRHPAARFCPDEQCAYRRRRAREAEAPRARIDDIDPQDRR